MDDLLNHPDLLFPSTDKGLGPCAVKFEQYVTNGLVHLTSATVYEWMSEEEAWQAVRDLSNNIEGWLTEHDGIILEMAQKYIRKHMAECGKSPFGQFYLLYEFIVSFGFSIIITHKREFKRPAKKVTKSKAS